MDRLPNEIKEQVCAYAANNCELKALRLLSRDWGAVGFPYLFRRAYLGSQLEARERFWALMENPLTRPHVHEIYVYNTFLPGTAFNHGQIGVSYLTYVRFVFQYIYKSRRNFNLSSQTRTAESKNSSLPFVRHWGSFLFFIQREAWVRANDASNEETSYAWNLVTANFTNLRRVTIDTTKPYNEQRLPGSSEIDEERSKVLDEFKPLRVSLKWPRAVQKCAVPSSDFSTEFDAVVWPTRYDLYWPGKNGYSNWRWLLKQLTHVRLVHAARTDREPKSLHCDYSAIAVDLTRQTGPKKHRVDKTASFGSAMECHQLISLSATFIDREPGEVLVVANKTLLPPRVKWLQQLNIVGYDISFKEISAFLESNRHTLTSLEIEDCSIDGDVCDLFVQLAEDFLLKHATFRGVIWESFGQGYLMSQPVDAMFETPSHNYFGTFGDQLALAVTARSRSVVRGWKRTDASAEDWIRYMFEQFGKKQRVCHGDSDTTMMIL